MPFLVEAVKNDSFPLPVTAGSENPDFFMISVSSWSQAGSLGTPIMSEGAVVGSQSALSSFRELLDKKPSYLRQKCFWWLSLN